ncbi:MAG: anion transporter [Candidatus Omnitrophica bacterium]|nr:anion transporter [Candidatus Omnitrophota bacterium]
MNTAALIVFAITYLLISLQNIRWFHLDRPSGALTGAVLAVLLGVVTLKEAALLIDYDILVLLLGMMILIGYLEVGNFFDWLSARLIVHAHKPLNLLWGLVFASAFLSCLFVNDTICLVMTPLILRTLKRARINAVPFLIALCTSANIGSVMTLTGNPQNMFIGIQSGWSYGAYAIRMLPVGLISLLFNGLLIYWFYRDDFKERRAPMTFHPDPPRLDGWLTLKAGLITVLVFIGFVTTHQLPLVAIAGGTLMILIAGKKPALAFEKIDWTLFVFFAGLFVVVGGVSKSGLPQYFYEHLRPWLGGNTANEIASFSLFSVLVSNLVSNVPYVILAGQWIPNFSDPKLMWLVLAMASTFAGNLTIVGSVANMIVMELAKDDVPVGFFQFFKVGFLTTAVSIAVGISFSLFYHTVGW